MSPQGKSSKASDSEQPATTMPITQAYEFQPGGHYIMEFDETALSLDDAQGISQIMLEVDVDVLMVGSRTGKALRPIPAVERTDHKEGE